MNTEHAVLRSSLEAYESLATASGLELRAVIALAAQDRLAEAIRLVEARRDRELAAANRRRQFDVLAKRRPR